MGLGGSLMMGVDWAMWADFICKTSQMTGKQCGQELL